MALETGRIVELRVGGQLIRTTHEHPFYVQGGGWRQACALSSGDLLRSHDGRWLPVESVSDTQSDVTVYNMRVEDYHTYFVGSPEWGFSVWSHNTPCRHYTNDIGREGISDSGKLRGDTYVTKPSEIPPRSGHIQIEKQLEIAPGRGTNYIEIDIPDENLRIPPNGPITSGGKWQRQIIEPVPINPRNWKRPPGRPAGG